MKALLLNDILYFKRPSVILSFVVCVVVSIWWGGADEYSQLNLFSNYGLMVMQIFSIIPVAIMAADEESGWQKYCITMPAKRTGYVLSKYIANMLISGAYMIVWLISCALNMAVLPVFRGHSFEFFIKMMFLMLTYWFVFQAIMIPFASRFHAKYCILILFFIGGLSSFCLGYIEGYTDGQFTAMLCSEGGDHKDTLIFASIALAAFALYVFSIKMSCVLFKSRDM